MGCLVKLADAILFIWFTIFVFVMPLFDAQVALPVEFYPKQLVDLKLLFANQFGHYLILEKPPFLVGLVWSELFFLWPLSIASLFALVSGRSWYQTTTLIYGVSWLTTLAAMVGDLWYSGRESEKLLMMYIPFVGLAILASLRGLLPSPKSQAQQRTKKKD